MCVLEILEENFVDEIEVMMCMLRYLGEIVLVFGCRDEWLVLGDWFFELEWVDLLVLWIFDEVDMVYYCFSGYNCLVLIVGFVCIDFMIFQLIGCDVVCVYIFLDICDIVVIVYIMYQLGYFFDQVFYGGYEFVWCNCFNVSQIVCNQ